MSRKEMIVTVRLMAGILSFFYIMAMGIDLGRSYLEDKAAWGYGPVKIYHGEFDETHTQVKPVPKKQKGVELI